MRHFIYVLIDPFTNDIRYIGKTTCLQSRIAMHCGKLAAGPVRRWIQALGCRPTVEVILTTADAAFAVEFEERMTAQLLNSGADLLNTKLGPYTSSKIKERRLRIRQRERNRASLIAKRRAKLAYDMNVMRKVRQSGYPDSAVLVQVRETRWDHDMCVIGSGPQIANQTSFGAA